MKQCTSVEGARVDPVMMLFGDGVVPAPARIRRPPRNTGGGMDRASDRRSDRARALVDPGPARLAAARIHLQQLGVRRNGESVAHGAA